MENPRPEKLAVVDEVKGRLDSADAVLLTEYRGMNVATLSRLRRELKPIGGEYSVYKNTLVRFAVQGRGLDGLDGLLTGPTALAFVHGDAAAVAKTLRDFARTNPALVVKGGVLGGRVLSATDVVALADLPSREVLLGRLAGGLQAPLAKLAGLLAAVPRSFAYGLKALIEARGGHPEPTEPDASRASASDTGAEPAEAAAEPGSATETAAADPADAADAAAEPGTATDTATADPAAEPAIQPSTAEPADDTVDDSAVPADPTPSSDAADQE